MNFIQAYNGIYPIGYGTKAKAMGGASIAFPQEVAVGLSNPAGLLLLGTRLDMSVDYLSPHIRYKLMNNHFRFRKLPSSFSSTYRNLLYFETGYNYAFCNERVALALLLTPIAGGRIHFSRPVDLTFSRASHSKELSRISSAYMALTPCLALKVIDSCRVGQHFFGVSADYTVGRLRVHGLNGPFYLTSIGSVSPNNVTNKRSSYARGYAIRGGWLGKFTDWLSIGFAYRSKTFMSPFRRYKGLVTPHGRADLPATYMGGIAIKPFRSTTIAFDVGRILNKDIKYLGNPVFDSSLVFTPANNAQRRGADNGAGFGWDSRTVYKIGLEQIFADSFSGRIGYNYAKNPQNPKVVGSIGQSFHNPSIIKHFITAGGTISIRCDLDVNFTYVHGVKHVIHGPIAPALGGGVGSISTSLNEVKLSISKLW